MSPLPCKQCPFGGYVAADEAVDGCELQQTLGEKLNAQMYRLCTWLSMSSSTAFKRPPTVLLLHSVTYCDATA